MWISKAICFISCGPSPLVVTAGVPNLSPLVICGGREANLRDLQVMIFDAGANGLMIGNYLTTPGRPAEEDLRMIEDLGLTPAPA